MKKQLFILTGVLSFTVLSAQTLVGTTSTPRNVVLEKFTGIQCTYCPDGEVKAMALYDAYPGRVNIINIHSKKAGLSTPGTGQPDFRTLWGDTIATMAGNGGPTGVPSGVGMPSAMANRQVWPGTIFTAPYYPWTGCRLDIGRQGFMAAGDTIINKSGNSPVNIGVKTTWNVTTRELIVNVELYYTAAQVVNNELNVVLVQSNIIGFQMSGGTSYNHKHILRDLITGQWGEVITTPGQGQFIAKTYTYTVPASYSGVTCNIADCDITVFVTDNAHKNIHTGITCKAENGQSTTTATGMDESLMSLGHVSVFPNPSCGNVFVTVSTPDSYRENSGPVNVNVYNVMGELILEMNDKTPVLKEFKSDSYRIDLGNKPNGIYLIEVKSGGSQIFRKVMINK